uniref:Uncharacterized protein n=1 Tax=Pyrodinium bahamense TaxID=73915 RepID=A0A7S0A5U6_9DINO|mmetsp:Transcript_22822/g.63539  ORF Transcript_22822/g.63539 Transcript_22822/m.63539 type:complete len:115 (+) Transcript_22822:85-429(+)
MAAPRARSALLATLLAAGSCALAARWALIAAFLPSPQTPSGAAAPAQLRGAPVVTAAVAVASAPLAAMAEDTLVEYNMAGEFTQFFVVGYFGLTTAFTAVAFLSYLVLTKLKII